MIIMVKMITIIINNDGVDKNNDTNSNNTNSGSSTTIC